MKTNPFRLFTKRLVQFPEECLRRFPLGLLGAFLAAWDWMVEIWSLHSSWILVRLLPFAIFGNIAWTLRCERVGGSRLKWPVLILLTALYGVAWFWMPTADTTSDSFWPAYLTACVVLGAITIACITTRNGRPDLREGAWILLSSAMLALFFSILLASGLSLALFSIDKLFGFSDGFPLGNIHLTIWLLAVFVVAPCILLGWLPRPGDRPVEIPKWLQTVCRTLFLPLCVLYALILLVYLGRVVLQGVWPDGWVSMPICIFATIGWLAWVFLRERPEGRPLPWVRVFLRTLPAVMVLFAVVLLLAMSVRLRAYGVTPPRAAGVYLGIWLLALGLFYTLRPAMSPWHLASTMALCAAVAWMGPLSLLNCTFRSQRPRLEAQWLQLTETSPDEARKGVRDNTHYLLYLFGFDGLPEAMQTRVQNVWLEENPGKTKDDFPDFLRKKDWYRVFSFHGGKCDFYCAALGVQDVEKMRKNDRFHLVDKPIRADGWTEIYLPDFDATGPLGFTRELPLKNLQGEPVAMEEQVAFCERLRQASAFTTESTQHDVTEDELSFEFDYEGKHWRIIFDRVAIEEDGTLSYAYTHLLLARPVAPKTHPPPPPTE